MPDCQAKLDLQYPPIRALFTPHNDAFPQCFIISWVIVWTAVLVHPNLIKISQYMIKLSSICKPNKHKEKPIKCGVYIIIVSFVVAILDLLVVNQVQSNILDSVRCYVAGEGLWSKGQKSAVYYLTRYAVSHDEQDYQGFVRGLAIPLGDKQARLALKAKQPNREKARLGFLQGKNHPNDIDNMINFFIYFENISYMREAIRIWTEADEKIAQLQKLGESLHQYYTEHQVEDISKTSSVLAEVNLLNQELTRLENDFSETLGEGARWIRKLTRNLVIGSILFLVTLVLFLSLRITRRIQKTQDDLLCSEARFRRIVDSNMIGIFFWQIDGMITDANDAFLEMLGYSRDELTEKQINCSDLTASGYKRVNEVVLQPSMEHDISSHTPYEKEYIHKDGHRVPVLIGSAFLDETNNALGVAFVLDISDRRKAEKALISAREEAEQANRAKSDFLSNMSHELRTPLNAILGFGQLIEMDSSLQDKKASLFAKEIVTAGEHLLELINDVLDLSKIEAGKLEILLEPVCIATVLNECVTLVAPLLKKNNLTLNVTTKNTNNIYVTADFTRLKQTILNLLSNAIKYNKPDGMISIEVFCTEAEITKIAITDTGQGMSSEQISQLFQTFTRFGDTQAIEGTGIGLVITKRLLELMKGTISVESIIGVGSRFCIELPSFALEPAEQKPQIAILAQASSLESQTVQKQYKILYIEDNPANMRVVQYMLEEFSNVVLLLAEIPSLGIDLALAEHPEIILLDINLPQMDGYKVIEILREKGFATTPIIAISANALPCDIERAKQAGFDEYLTKPIKIDRLQETLNKFIPIA